jgi:hypothetical protein
MKRFVIVVGVSLAARYSPRRRTRTSVDSEGNFYTAEVDTGRVQKFRPLTDANPRYLVSPL